MPYIARHLRETLNEVIDEVRGLIEPGILNYTITRICHNYLHNSATPANYAKYNEVIGVLECAKLELYRKQVALYEDEKCEANGEVGYSGRSPQSR